MKSANPSPSQPATRRRAWQADLAIVERGGQTTARAFLVGDGPPLSGDGRARRKPSEGQSVVAAEEIAVARALRQLADRLLRAAGTDIGLLEGRDAVVVSPR